MYVYITHQIHMIDIYICTYNYIIMYHICIIYALSENGYSQMAILMGQNMGEIMMNHS